MKKFVATVSVVSMLAMGAMPAFADEHGHHQENQQESNYSFGDTNVSNNGNNNVELDDINGHWAQKYIVALVKQGILHGKEKHKYDPDNQVTRAEWATMVSQYFHLNATGTTQDFNDVPVNSWEYKYVDATQNYFDKYVDLNGGFDFHPNEGAKRQDVTVTLVRVLTKLDPSIQLMDQASAQALLQAQFKDASSINSKLAPFVATAVKYNLIHGSNGNFNPTKTLNRAEAATLLYMLESNAIVVDGTGTGTTTTTGTTTGTGTTTTGTGTTTTGAGTTTTGTGTTTTGTGTTTTGTGTTTTGAGTTTTGTTTTGTGTTTTTTGTSN